MNYFILYIAYAPDFTEELYIKSKSMKRLLERIGRYSEGLPCHKQRQHTDHPSPVRVRKRNQSKSLRNKENRLWCHK